MKTSEEQLKRTTNVFSNYAKEQVRVEIIEDYLYGFIPSKSFDTYPTITPNNIEPMNIFKVS